MSIRNCYLNLNRACTQAHTHKRTHVHAHTCTHNYTHSRKHACPEAGVYLPGKFHDHIANVDNKINIL